MNIWSKAIKGQEQKDREALAAHGIPAWVADFAASAYGANINPLPTLRRIFPSVHWSANGGFHHQPKSVFTLGDIVVDFAVGSQLGITVFKVSEEDLKPE